MILVIILALVVGMVLGPPGVSLVFKIFEWIAYPREAPWLVKYGCMPLFILWLLLVLLASA